jgi:crotonobetainyl-CoA:carnitine CoA-transferase CaiB-like acyl-CoA transferase
MPEVQRTMGLPHVLPVSSARPLAGIRVLELARILAGPWCGQLLADLGADVIKVESPDGDDTRGWGPPFVTGAEGQSLSAAYFHSCNRGKRSVVADFRVAADVAGVKRLAAGADVLIENFKVGGLKRYGLDAPALRAEFPRLVTCSITGFGQNGPYAERAGYDFLIQGMAGPMSITGAPDGLPMKTGYATADIFTGLYATTAILAALRQRDATGEGAMLDLALMDAQVAVLGNQAMNYLVSGKPPGRLGNAHPNIVPYEVFAVADGHVIIAVGNDGQFARLCAVLGEPALAQNPDYATNTARVLNRAVLVPLLAPLLAGRHKAELLEALEAATVPAGPINRLDEVFANPQVQARGLKVTLPAADGTPVPGVASPIVMDGVRQVAATPSPALGSEALEDAQWR